ncbi:methyl-accepting chemotaxis protein [Chamaesiphon sp. VAR_48_metabat_135_sub]|uniref:methyl-accepting chemotaxis protein n=1 Tax=Chamaesiphon sp. VAR_48_metabat_135_sub TaxID=2964699 RepID=UPI00286C8EC2|nr:methyl-accepting chemotaxis protein [Chamaesiphon sp. VAR_48_metabat_135_sub]
MSTNLWTKVNTLSFKTKTTLMAIAVGVLPIATVGTLNYLQTRNTIQQKAVQDRVTRATSVADKLNRFVFERNGDVTVLSSLPIFADPKVAAITSVERKSQLLDRFVSVYQVYDSIAAFDLQGNSIVQSKGEKLGNHFDRNYFQEILKTGKVVISEPHLAKSTGKLVIAFAAPIRDSTTNKIIGVVRTRTPVDRLAVVLKDFANKSENYHILDLQTNKLFISSNGQYLNQPETPDMIQARSKADMVYHKSSGGSDRAELLTMAPFAKLEGMKELPWIAVTTIDEDAAYVELQGLLWTILVGAGFTAGLTIAASTFFADRITKYIQQAIATITTSANEIVDTVQSQEIAVNQQANSAISTTDSINELESISTETAEQADASATGARHALSLAEEGTQSVQRTIHEMSDLRDRVDEIAQQIVNLGEQTGQITTVSDLVSDLAKQTNMLALKAAVEAARAGEQGKGFGVVAGEIRKLADESKKSAQKINNLATDIQAAINRTVIVTDRGTKTATEGIQLAENTATTFIGVTDAVNNVFLNSQQISASTKRQATAIQQVLGAMNTISQGSQESAIGMHKVKISTSELNQIADELQAAVS